MYKGDCRPVPKLAMRFFSSISRCKRSVVVARTLGRISLLVVCLQLHSSPVNAQDKASPTDTVKVIIHKRSQMTDAGLAGTVDISQKVLTRPGVVRIDEQQGYVLVEAPAKELSALQQDALDSGALGVEVRYDFDRLDFLSFPIDGREPAAAYPIAYTRKVPLPSPARDSFLVQFKSAPRSEWMDALHETGSSVVDYIPNNAYVILGSADVLSAWAAQLPVQLLRLHQPVHKTDAALRESATEFEDINLILLNVPEAEDVREYLKTVALTGDAFQKSSGDRSYLRMTVTADSVSHLAAFPAVVWIERSALAAPSGEREVNIATGRGSWIYPQTLTPGAAGT